MSNSVLKNDKSFSLLFWGFLILAGCLVALKEHHQEDNSNILVLFDKTREAISQQKKVPVDQITLKSKFNRDLNFQDLDQDTLALQLNKKMGIDLDLNVFRKLETVGEAVDYIRTRMELKHEKSGSKNGK
ncbi:hypothetical protein GC174_01135 [bacterium]|nr:hypothetical protein [bacterium]